MATSFKALASRLGESRDGELPSIQFFPPLDLDQISRQLELEVRGSDHGKRNLPAPEAQVPDLAELEIRSEIERRTRKALEDYRSQLNLYESRARRAIVTPEEPAEIAAAGEAALADFKVHVANDLDHLHIEQHKVKASQEELQRFQATHGLRRFPRVPTSRETRFRVIVLLIFVSIESFLNGTFFAEGSDQGMIGGVQQALVFSALNIGAAVICALYFIPLLRHRRRSANVLGMSLVLLYTLFDIAFNLCIAHFRDLFSASDGIVSAHVFWQQLFQQPLSLADMQSWVLFCAGIALSVAALLDASGLGDPYPGFSRIGRKYESAVSSYATSKAHRLGDLMERRDRALSEMKDVIATIKSRDLDVRLAHEGSARLHQELIAFLDHLASAHELLVLRYREFNRRTRTMSPPGYFASLPSRPDFLEAPTAPNLPHPSEVFSEKVVVHMEHYIRAVSTEFTEALTKYQSVSHLTASSGHVAS